VSSVLCRQALIALLLTATAATAQDVHTSGMDAPAKATSVPTATAATTTSDEAFRTRVNTLEERVVDLKEKIFRSKARLLLLQETVLGGDISTGARAVIVHQNEMGNSFVLESVSYALDGAPLFTKSDVGGNLASQKEIEVFNGRIVPGQHQLAVRLVYRGNGFGVFNYVDGYRFTVQNSFTVEMEPGKATTARIVAYERGDITTDLKERPAVRLETQVTRDAPSNLPPQTADGASASDTSR